jgi:hypothetical protein
MASNSVITFSFVLILAPQRGEVPFAFEVAKELRNNGCVYSAGTGSIRK